MNPYYNPESCGLRELLSFDEPALSYEYNTLCFWKDAAGEVYSARDSGCSCPTPFENHHDRETVAEVIATLTHVDCLADALRLLAEWGADDTAENRSKLTRWWYAGR